jgi:N,N-dimethylformamidase
VKVVGYSDRLSVRAGEPLEFRVSCDSPEYSVQIIRLIHGDENPRGPGFKSEDIDVAANRSYSGRVQAIHGGSFVEFERDGPLRDLRTFTLSAWIYPTAVDRGAQAILAAGCAGGPGYGLFIGPDGTMQLRLAHGDGRRLEVSSPMPLVESAWQFVAASVDLSAGTATLVHRRAEWSPEGDESSITERFGGWRDWGGGTTAFLIGACAPSTATESTARAVSCFNGKIEDPIVLATALDDQAMLRLAALPADDIPPEAIARWDFSLDQSSRTIRDRSTNGVHGRTVNLPTRAVTGRRWDGSSISFDDRPDMYAAIHFHDDDLDDAGWATDFVVDVPSHIASGVYAARISLADGSRDHVPFFVRPARDAPRQDVLMLISTFSYLAYANDHVAADPATRDSLGLGDEFRYPVQPEDHYILANPLNSMYDRHSDGSAVVYSSHLRPIMNMRPAYRQPLINMGRGDPHLLPADLHLVDWLERFGYGYDVVTDHDVHAEGAGALAGYKAVVTGTHPEYWSGRGLDAVASYLASGGRLLYVGGNGFYWVTSVEAEGHTIEVRKWGGTAPVVVSPGEVMHSTTGELGGLWRFRGRAPQRLVGVGMSAQGVDVNAPYRLLPDSADPRASFIFDGIDAEQLIGDHPSLVNEYGPGGYEIDRLDFDLGTPRHALLLATTTGLSDWYQHVQEEILLADSKQSGTINPKVRADMVYFECPNGGAVWSVGSIAWCACLSYNDYDNAVSRITRNVLDRFVS